MGKIIQSIMDFGNKLFDEVIVRTTVETLQKAATEQTQKSLRRLTVRFFGWGENDERIFLETQSNLGPEAIKKLNLWLESLNDYWTYRFRIIISGIEDQEKRLAILKMMLNAEPDERRRQLEQVCQTPEYLTKAAKWIWKRLKAVMSDSELRDDALKLAGEIDQKLGKRKGVFVKTLLRFAKGATKTVDDIARDAARSIRRYRRETAERKKQSLGWWIIPRILIGYDRRLSPKWRNKR